MKIKRQFADDLDQGGNNHKEGGQNLNQHGGLQNKWNAIQDDYLKKYPDLEIDDLYFEGGGFKRLLEKISELRGISIQEVRSEIANW